MKKILRISLTNVFLLLICEVTQAATKLVDDIFYVEENALTRQLSVLDNDTLADCSGCTVAISVTNSIPSNLIVRGASGISPKVSFQAPADFIGTASFTYAYDINGQAQGTAVVTVFVGVNNANFNSEETTAYIALMNACDGANGELQETCIMIDAMDDATAHSAINQIMPRDVASQAESSIEAQRSQLGNINTRLQEIRNGVKGASVSNLTVSLQGQELPAGLLLNELLSGGAAGDDSDSWISDYGFFMSGNLGGGDKNNTGQELGYKLNNTSITLGMDKRINSDLVAGLALGIGRSAIDYSYNRGGQDIDSFNLMFYGNYYPTDSWHIDIMMAYATNDYDLERHINAGALNTTALGNTSGNQYSLALSSGYGWFHKAFQYAVYGRFEFIDTSIEAYNETGGAGLALSMGEQSSDSLEAFLGGRLSYVKSMKFGVLIPTIEAEYVSQLTGDARAIEADFAHSSSTDSAFSIQTDPQEDGYLNVAANLSATFANGRSAFMRYQQTLALDNYSGYQISLGGRISF